MSGDIDKSGSAQKEKGRSGSLFDIRVVVGGVFVVYGVVLTITGLLDTAASLVKANGIRINLWVGLAMLAFGLAMFAWRWRRPLRRDDG